MGRKPVLGLVGACLTSMAFTGCWDNCCLWDRSPKKDTTITSTAGGGTRTTGSDTGWREQPRVGSSGGGTFNNGTTAGSGGGASGGGPFTAGGGAGGSGSLTPGGGSPPYPGGNSMREPAGGGSFERTSPPGPAGPDVNGGRSTQPVNYNDTTSGGAGAPPSPSTLPPLVAPGPARPRTDDLTTGKNVRSPVIDPPPLSAPTSGGGLPPAPTSGAALPTAPAASDAPSFGGGTSDGLPPIPTPASQKGLERGPLPPPAPPPVSGSGVPSLPRNPATMQN